MCSYTSSWDLTATALKRGKLRRRVGVKAWVLASGVKPSWQP
jgi:hypothetical protein